jgi:hypothetical protein
VRIDRPARFCPPLFPDRLSLRRQSGVNRFADAPREDVRVGARLSMRWPAGLATGRMGRIALAGRRRAQAVDLFEHRGGIAARRIGQWGRPCGCGFRRIGGTNGSRGPHFRSASGGSPKNGRAPENAGLSPDATRPRNARCAKISKNDQQRKTIKNEHNPEVAVTPEMGWGGPLKAGVILNRRRARPNVGNDLKCRKKWPDGLFPAARSGLSAAAPRFFFR